MALFDPFSSPSKINNGHVHSNEMHQSNWNRSEQWTLGRKYFCSQTFFPPPALKPRQQSWLLNAGPNECD
jgi:hypothetical protein